MGGNLAGGLGMKGWRNEKEGVGASVTRGRSMMYKGESYE